MTYTLRPYQSSGIEMVRSELRSGKQSGIISAPTGSGKTVVGAHLVEAANIKGTRTLFVAHRTELIEQASAKLKENGILHGIIKSGFDPDPYQRVQIASIQTYRARIGKLEHGYKLIIIDECHHAAATSYLMLMKENPGAIILGLTATPYRSDGKGLKDIFSFIVELSTISELIEAGHLVPARVYTGQKIDLKGIRTVAGDYAQDELAERMNRPNLTGNIVKEWIRLAFGRISVVFAASVAHSKAISAAFTASGIRAEHLDGETPANERRATLERLATGRTQIVTNCSVLCEGWDCPPCSCIILARPTKSRGLWRQMIGRALRPYPGKRDCLILDHANCTDLHGYITDPDKITLEGGLAKEEPKKYYKCRACGAKLASAPRYCPACGRDCMAVIQQGELLLPDGVNGAYELIERRPENHPDRRPSSALFGPVEIKYLRMRRIAFERGYKPGWAAGIYARETGRAPSDKLRAQSKYKSVLGPDGKEAWIAERILEAEHHAG